MTVKTLTTDPRGNRLSVTWPGIGTDGIGQAWERADFQDKCVHVLGDFGTGAKCTIQGSNDGVNWLPLTDTNDDPLEFTSAGIAQILQNPRWIRPVVDDGGTNPAITIIIEATKGF